jgi:hypothetical protein
MAQSIIIGALIEKRSEVSGIIAELEERTRQSRANLAHIDATLRLFDPEIKVATIRGKKPPTKSSLFANGEISKRCREAIRRAGGDPVAAEDIVRQAMTDKGLDTGDRLARLKMNRSFLWALHRMHVAGTIAKVGHGAPAECPLRRRRPGRLDDGKGRRADVTLP